MVIAVDCSTYHLPIIQRPWRSLASHFATFNVTPITNDCMRKHYEQSTRKPIDTLQDKAIVYTRHPSETRSRGNCLGSKSTLIELRAKKVLKRSASSFIEKHASDGGTMERFNRAVFRPSWSIIERRALHKRVAIQTTTNGTTGCGQGTADRIGRVRRKSINPPADCRSSRRSTAIRSDLAVVALRLIRRRACRPEVVIRGPTALRAPPSN
uniref:Uncharacterized protein n=1 Tax=Plectus sambesii TaxID=2011161 RepID=A0A914V7Z7_9BILA